MKTVLFDLDGTLLPLDLNYFLKEYMTAISGYFSDLVDPGKFTRALLNSTGVMVKNDGRITNQELFMNDFIPVVGIERETLYLRLEKFYTEEFGRLRRCVKQAELSAQVVQAVLDRGFRIVLATNPLFPLTAIRQRMDWAGVDHFPWAHITAFEECRACKPNPAYFREIMEKLDLNPQECWMVGNDTEEDLVAAQLGLKTYLVKDYLIEKGNYIKPDAQGSLQDFLDFAKNKL